MTSPTLDHLLNFRILRVYDLKLIGKRGAQVGFFHILQLDRNIALIHIF